MGTKFDDYMAASDTTATEDERELATAFDAHYKAVYLESVLTRSWLRLARRPRSADRPLRALRDSTA